MDILRIIVFFLALSYLIARIYWSMEKLLGWQIASTAETRGRDALTFPSVTICPMPMTFEQKSDLDMQGWPITTGRGCVNAKIRPNSFPSLLLQLILALALPKLSTK